MADVFTKEQRSYIMRQIKSRRNKSTELKLISYFKANHIKGWRRNYIVFGKPDFVFQPYKIAIFVDGCFWHGHNCRNTKPKENHEFWFKKIERNRQRDIDVSEKLKKKGWEVIRIWECELKNQELVDKLYKEKLLYTTYSKKRE